MQTKEEIKAMAQTFREAGDILDEIADFSDNKKDITPEERKEKEEDLLGRFAVKMIKIQSFR